jgi:holo-[acyl-carrier protein] synthase
MILGLGVDIIEIERIQNALGKARFQEKIFTPQELEYADPHAAERCAGLFAAKEAAAKALGTGFCGFSPRDIEILHDEAGKPFICPRGAFREQILQKRVDAIHVSISHDRSRAIACVILEGSI